MKDTNVYTSGYTFFRFT